ANHGGRLGVRTLAPERRQAGASAQHRDRLQNFTPRKMDMSHRQILLEIEVEQRLFVTPREQNFAPKSRNRAWKPSCSKCRSLVRASRMPSRRITSIEMQSVRLKPLSGRAPYRFKPARKMSRVDKTTRAVGLMSICLTLTAILWR